MSVGRLSVVHPKEQTTSRGEVARRALTGLFVAEGRSGRLGSKRKNQA